MVRMGRWSAAAAPGLAAMAAGCTLVVGDAPLVGPDRSFEEAMEIAEAQRSDVMDIAAAEGATPWADLPVSGSAEYRGVVSGEAAGGVPIDYVADLALEVDFRDRTVTGTVANMVTDGVAGFTHPDGVVALGGLLAEDRAGDARLVLDGTGNLRGPGMAAAYRIDGAGTLAGADGRAILGRHATDFEWTQGYLEDTISSSDGVFSAVAEE